MNTIDDKFVVQVRPGGQPGGTDVTDRLALLHLLPFFHRPLGEMQVLGFNTVSVFDKHVVPIGF